MNLHISIDQIINTAAAMVLASVLISLLKWLSKTARAIVANDSVRQTLTAAFKNANRRPIWEGFISASFFVVLVLMFFDPSPVTRLTVAFEFLVIAVAATYGLIFTFRLALLRAQQPL